MFTDDHGLVTFVEQKTGAKIHSLQWPQRGRDTFEFKLQGDEDWYYLNQSSGKIFNSHDTWGSRIFGFVLDLHKTLTLGKTGKYITGICSVIFVFSILTSGLYLWWPRNKGRVKSSYKIKFNGSAKRRNYDIHNVSGFYFAVPLFLMGLTGGYFMFADQYQAAIDTITFSKPAHNHWANPKYEHGQTKEPLTIYQALDILDAHYPNMRKRNLWMPTQADEYITFSYHQENQVHAGSDNRVFVKADQYTGVIISEYNPDTLPLGSSLTARWIQPLHFGEFGGFLTRIIWFVAGFLPALLFYSGVKIWLGRKRNRRMLLKLTT